MNVDIVTIGIGVLAFVAIVGLGFAFSGADRGKQSKRIKGISDGASAVSNCTGSALVKS